MSEEEDELWPESEAEQILHENGIRVEEEEYVTYNPNNRGCNIDDPIVITRTEDYVHLEYEILDELITAYPRFSSYERTMQQLTGDDDRSIDILTVEVDGHEEKYYFDITAGSKALEDLFMLHSGLSCRMKRKLCTVFSAFFSKSCTIFSANLYLCGK